MKRSIPGGDAAVFAVNMLLKRKPVKEGLRMLYLGTCMEALRQGL